MRRLGVEVEAHNAILRVIAGRELTETCGVLAKSLRVAVGAYRVADFKQTEQWSRQPVPGWDGPDGRVAAPAFSS